MSKKWYLRSLYYPIILSVLAGCGNRGIPAIKQELLDQKLSVLMLSSAKLTASTKESVGQSLMKWRDGNSIAFDWVKDLNQLDDNVYHKVENEII